MALPVRDEESRDRAGARAGCSIWRRGRSSGTCRGTRQPAVRGPPTHCAPRTKWTRLVPHPVLSGHASSHTPYYLDTTRPSPRGPPTPCAPRAPPPQGCCCRRRASTGTSTGSSTNSSRAGRGAGARAVTARWARGAVQTRGACAWATSHTSSAVSRVTGAARPDAARATSGSEAGLFLLRRALAERRRAPDAAAAGRARAGARSSRSCSLQTARSSRLLGAPRPCAPFRSPPPPRSSLLAHTFLHEPLRFRKLAPPLLLMSLANPTAATPKPLPVSPPCATRPLRRRASFADAFRSQVGRHRQAMGPRSRRAPPHHRRTGRAPAPPPAPKRIRARSQRKTAPMAHLRPLSVLTRARATYTLNPKP